MYKEIRIQTKKDLDIYMNPQRQRLLKCMGINGIPMTPKQLSDQLGISPSSVTYHIKKLEELGVVELDHTEMVHGILARYYKRIPVLVCLNAGTKDDMQLEKEVLMDYMMNDIWSHFKTYLKNGDDSPEELKGDAVSGMMYLDDNDIRQLKQFFDDFQKAHSIPKEGAAAWEAALIAYPRKGV